MPRRSKHIQKSTPISTPTGWRNRFPTAFCLLDWWAAPYSTKNLRFLAYQVHALELHHINHGLTIEGDM